ncbi:hypothetical protein N7495_008567 [Penicillium taxi]|uniref:uncharacterized protein n=1 Tax=Penicillium taxi TaxID=168475 RepID=UPI002544EF6C|nr:uncharacterized protein N7495_008567 [Penicillium taxi]KAJ5888526.1 hypothetical protein N7495_008567 [Penicillium taxi]
MSRRTPLYLGLAVAGAGGYYLYRAGGDVKSAKHELKIDAEKAREKLPHSDNLQQKGQDIGKEAGGQIDDALNNARSKFNQLDERTSELAHDGKSKFSELSEEARAKFNAGVDKADRTVEKTAADAKGTVNGWFGGKK